MKSPFRVSIMALICLVGLCAGGLAALRTPTVLGAQSSYSIALTTLLIASLWAFQTPRSTFAGGFVLFGGIYFVFLFCELFANYSRTLSLTTPLLKEFYDQVALVRGWERLRDRHYVPGFSVDRLDMVPNSPEYVRFETIGHSCFTILFGVVGGSLAVTIARLKGRPE